MARNDPEVDGSDLSHHVDSLNPVPINEEKDTRGYTVAFNLPKDLTLTLVSGYSTLLRARIIDRWLELEGKEQQAKLAHLLENKDRTIQALCHQVAALAP